MNWIRFKDIGTDDERRYAGVLKKQLQGSPIYDKIFKGERDTARIDIDAVHAEKQKQHDTIDFAQRIYYKLAEIYNNDDLLIAKEIAAVLDKPNFYNIRNQLNSTLWSSRQNNTGIFCWTTPTIVKLLINYNKIKKILR